MFTIIEIRSIFQTCLIRTCMPSLRTQFDVPNHSNMLGIAINPIQGEKFLTVAMLLYI
jgi:hypothetical protein